MSKAIRAAGAPGEEGARSAPRLPRWLQRRIRGLARRSWRMPRHAGLKATAFLFVATATTGVVAGDRSQDLAIWLSSISGLTIDTVRITGQTETSETDVLDRLRLPADASLATLDVGAARQRIETLPWVETATLRKIYPATLKISIEERKPYVLWQHGQALSVIDDTGKVIGDGSDSHYDDLLKVVGDGADKRAAEALAVAASAPSIERRVKTAVLIADRRWNLILDNGVTVMLPQDQPEATLARLADLDGHTGLLSRDITSVDLRLGDRMFVRLTPDAEARRLADLKEQEKLAKRKGAST